MCKQTAIVIQFVNLQHNDDNTAWQNKSTHQTQQKKRQTDNTLCSHKDDTALKLSLEKKYPEANLNWLILVEPHSYLMSLYKRRDPCKLQAHCMTVPNRQDPYRGHLNKT